MSPQNGANPQTPSYNGSAPNTNSYNNYNAYSNRTGMSEFGSPNTTNTRNNVISTGVAAPANDFASYAPKDANSSLSKDPAYSYNLGELLAAPTPNSTPQYSSPVAQTPKVVDPFSQLSSRQQSWITNIDNNGSYGDENEREKQINYLLKSGVDPWIEQQNSMLGG